MQLASSGIHSLSLRLSNKNPRVSYGKPLARIVQFIYRWLEICDNHVNVNEIILASHSFGGAAVAIALAEGATTTGAIWLALAAICSELPVSLRANQKARADHWG